MLCTCGTEAGYHMGALVSRHEGGLHVRCALWAELGAGR